MKMKKFRISDCGLGIAEIEKRKAEKSFNFWVRWGRSPPFGGGFLILEFGFGI